MPGFLNRGPTIPPRSTNTPYIFRITIMIKLKSGCRPFEITPTRRLRIICLGVQILPLPIFSYKGSYHMKATGIVRRIDDLGRVVIPKEIRRTMRIR